MELSLLYQNLRSFERSWSLIIVFGLVKAILTWAQLNVAANLAKNLTQRLSTQVFNHLQRLPVVWHNKQEQGDLAQRATGNINDLEKFVADGMVELVAGVLTILGVLITMAMQGASIYIPSLRETVSILVLK